MWIDHCLWIDHCFIFSHDVNSLISCNIVQLDGDNLSDHLPIRTSFFLPSLATGSCKSGAHGQGGEGMRDFDQKLFCLPRWDTEKKRKYNHILDNKLKSIPILHMEDNITNVQHDIDTYVETLNKAIHEAAQEAGCIPKKHYRPKDYWCPELSALRDKKKFWWRLWVENNKPRNGPIFDILKYLKKKFRKLSRQCILDQKKNKYHNLNSLFSDKKLPQFP